MEDMVLDTMVVTKDGKKGIVNSIGEEILEPIYEEAYSFSEDGLALVTSIGEVEVLWVTHEGEKLMTDGMKALVAEKN